MLRSCAICLCLALLTGCQAPNPYQAAARPIPPPPALTTPVQDPSAYPATPTDFARYRTWSWRNAATDTHLYAGADVRTAFSQAFDQRGLRPALNGPADLLVDLDLQQQTRLRQVYDDRGPYYPDPVFDRYGRPAAYGAAPPVRIYEEQVLVVQIELFDARNGRSLWRERTEIASPQGRDDRQEALRHAARQLMSAYPPHG